MSYLADTNLLVRLANSRNPAHPVAAWAVDELHRQGESICIAPQILIEFRAVATRLVASNGLGLSAVEAENKSAEFEAIFPLLQETPAIFPAWKDLVAAAGVMHDARLIAVCHAHGVTHLLTFNGMHFRRLAGFGPGIEVVDPAEI